MPATDLAARTATELLDALFRDLPARDFVVRLWDGTTWPAQPGAAPRFTVTIHDPGVLRRLVLARDEAGLGEGYVTGEFDLEGDLEAVGPLAEELLRHPPRLRDRATLLATALRLPRQPGAPAPAPRSHGSPLPWRRRPAGRRHSPARDGSVVRYHYDASNRFYKLFLDPRMVYSCAYFAAPDESLEDAQLRKLDYVCRKLRLRPDEHLLDIGCGWGALLVHGALKYGVYADGVTLSQNQADVAREYIRTAGLEDRCTVRVMDYRAFASEGVYDKVASVGMFEHVGRRAMATYYRQVFRLLRPGGMFLNQAIGGTLEDADRGQSFTDRWVFPDSELLPISEALRGAEAIGFDVRDVENLREHYALTLRHWLRALEQNREEAVQAAGQQRWRAWRLVFASAAHRFEAGKQHVYQTLLVKPDAAGSAGLPLTRADWYAGDSPGERKPAGRPARQRSAR